MSGVFVQVIRKSIAELAIGAGVCAGAMVMLVTPLSQKLDDAQKQCAALRQQIANHKVHTDGPTQAAAGKDAEAALESVAQRGGLVEQRTEMFRRIMSLAEQCGLRVNQFQPVVPRGLTVKAPVAAAPAATGMVTPGQSQAPAAPAKPQFESRSAYSIALQGSYAGLVAFVRELQCEVGFTGVHAINVSGGTSDGLLSFTVETEHVGLDVRSFLKAHTAAATSSASGAPQGQTQTASVPTPAPGGTP